MKKEDMDLAAQLGDMKEVDYHNTLLISTLVELLIEKEIVTREEIVSVMHELDSEMLVTTDESWAEFANREDR